MTMSHSQSTTAAPSHCLLFAYGQLQPGIRSPRTMRRAWPDRVRGELFDLGPYPAAVRIGAAEGSFCGHVIEIDASELAELDTFEGVGEGLYRRVRATTEAGQSVWIYQYARPLPADARGPVERWPSAEGVGQ